MSKKVPITLTAVAAYKVDYLTAESVLIEIEDGVVVKVTPVTRAPDQHATAIHKCHPLLWSTLRTNPAYEPTNEQPIKPKAPIKPITKEG